MSAVVTNTITEEKLTDVLLDLKKTLQLTFQQLADICQVSLASAKGKIRGRSKVSIRDLAYLVNYYGNCSYISIESTLESDTGVIVYIYIHDGNIEYEHCFIMDLA